MTRIETACYALIASAFVLTAMLVVALDARFTASADAAMVIARENFTLMTAKTRDGEEAVFVLDNARERLLIYRLAIQDKQLELVEARSLPNLFAQNSPRGGDTDGGRTRERRAR